MGEPQMTSREREVYSRASDVMNTYHNHFRRQWTVLYKAASTGRRPANLTVRQFLNLGEEFCERLTLHHTIEETHLFPVLATRMPAFKRELQMLTQHKAIHGGVVRLQQYLGEVKASHKDFRLDELLEVLDSFGRVLWEHLDEEVKELGPENMQKYWSVEECQRLPL